MNDIRVWSFHKNKMFYRKDLDYITLYNIVDYWEAVKDDVVVCGCRFNEYLDFDNGVLMFSSGLKDKNEREMFDGDIFKDVKLNDYGRILFKDGGFGFKLIPDSKYHDFVSFSGHDYLKEILESFEVVGNIYENKNLLK